MRALVHAHRCLALLLLGIVAMMAAGWILAGGGKLIRGVALITVGALLLGLVVLIPERKPRTTRPEGKEPSPVSACEHEWFDEDQLLNYDPKCHRCLKCGEIMWG
jgi:hypothetical protein